MSQSLSLSKAQAYKKAKSQKLASLFDTRYLYFLPLKYISNVWIEFPF